MYCAGQSQECQTSRQKGWRIPPLRSPAILSGKRRNDDVTNFTVICTTSLFLCTLPVVSTHLTPVTREIEAQLHTATDNSICSGIVYVNQYSKHQQFNCHCAVSGPRQWCIPGTVLQPSLRCCECTERKSDTDHGHKQGATTKGPIQNHSPSPSKYCTDTCTQFSSSRSCRMKLNIHVRYSQYLYFCNLPHYYTKTRKDWRMIHLVLVIAQYYYEHHVSTPTLICLASAE
jgi:hypothetical protein